MLSQVATLIGRAMVSTENGIGRTRHHPDSHAGSRLVIEMKEQSVKATLSEHPVKVSMLLPLPAVGPAGERGRKEGAKQLSGVASTMLRSRGMQLAARADIATWISLLCGIDAL